MNIFFKIINELKLDKYLSILIKKNKSNNAPYHNMYHSLCVMKNVYNISKSIKLDKEDIRKLCIAAIFHDFNHSQGKLKDDKNIKESIDNYFKYTKETKDVDYDVVNIIESTQYPYVIEDKDLNILQKVIRDADMMQMLEDNYIQQVLIGLATEMNVNITDFISMQEKFFSNLKFHTKFAKNKFDLNKNSLKEDLEFLNSIL